MYGRIAIPPVALAMAISSGGASGAALLGAEAPSPSSLADCDGIVFGEVSDLKVRICNTVVSRLF
jgi:hypothetical protein